MKDPSPRHGRLRPLVLMVCIGAVLAAGMLARHMGVDEGIWNHMGRMWVHGAPVYRETVDNKPPGIFMVYALTYFLSGPGYLLPRMLGLLSLVATTALVYLLGRDLHSRRAGLLAGTMFGLSLGWEVTDGPYLAQTESFMLLPAMLAFWMLLRPRTAGLRTGNCGTTGLPIDTGNNSEDANTEIGVPKAFLAGLLLGAALSFKQTVLFSVLSWGILYLLLSRRQRQPIQRTLTGASTFTVGVAVGMAAFILPVLACGVEFKDYWFCTWVLPLLKGTGNPDVANRLMKTFCVWFLTPLAMFYLPLGTFFFRSKSLRSRGVPLLALTIWLVLEFVGSASSGFWYGHQIRQVLPVLALIGGIGLASALEWAPPAAGRKAAVAAFLVLVMAFLPIKMPYEAIAKRGVDMHRKVGLAVRDSCGQDDYVLNMDDGNGFQILAWSDRPSPTRWFNIMLVQADSSTQMRRELELHPPRTIFVPTWWYFDHEPYPGKKPVPWPECMAQYRGKCQWLATLPVEGDSYDIFRVTLQKN